MSRPNGRVSCALLALSLIMFSLLEDNVDCANEIPLSMLRQTMAKQSSKDFIKKLITIKLSRGRGTEVRLPEEKILFTAQGALDPTGVDIIAAQMAEPAHCMPSMQAVPFPRSNQANSIFWPTCVNVQRCGGCCGSEILSCVPTSTKMVTFHVMNATYPYAGAEQFEFEGMASFQLEQHQACECRCTIQPKHCHPTKHTYLSNSCRCKCKDTSGSTRCSLSKKWDERQCACVCKRRHSCYNNEYFDSHSCSCQRRRGRMRSSPTRFSNPCANVTCDLTKEPVIHGDTCICKVDPCKSLTCRSQFEPVRVGSKCECRYAQSAGVDILPGSLDVFGIGDREEQTDETSVAEGGLNLGNLGDGDEFSLPDEEPTTTTVSPPRRTPSRRRGRSRGHSALPGSMIAV